MRSWIAVFAAVLIGACDKLPCPTGTRDVEGHCISATAKEDTDEKTQANAAEGAAGKSPMAGSAAPVAGAAVTGGARAPQPAAGSAGAQIAAAGAAAPPPSAAAGSGNTAEPCAEEGAMRCSSTSTAGTELCSNGAWVTGGSCKPSEVCSMMAGAPVCRSLEEACRGNAGGNICDPQGALLGCNPDGSAEVVERCDNVALCQAGLAARKCASCMPGTFRCTGTALESCGPDGQGFTAQMSCMTRELCNAAAGACTNATCTAGQYTCQGDVLKQCNPTLTGWADVRTCSPGMCDAAGKACRICMPGQAMCQGNALSTCDARGQAYTSSNCPSATPYCVGQGKCVACKSDADCKAEACEVRTCNVSAGTCSAATAAPRGTKCTAPAPDSSLSAQCTDDKVCAPVIAITIDARTAGDGTTPIGQAYVSANPDGFIKAAGMNGGPPGAWEPFLLIRESPGSNRAALFSLANGGYVTPVAPPPGGVPAGKPWPERKWLGSRSASRAIFEFSSTSIGQSITIRSPSEGYFWSAEDWVDPPSDYIVRVRTPASDVGPWEHFRLIRYP